MSISRDGQKLTAAAGADSSASGRDEVGRGKGE